MSETRTELFDALLSLSELVPEMRAAQIMAALGDCGMPPTPNSSKRYGSFGENTSRHDPLHIPSNFIS